MDLTVCPSDMIPVPRGTDEKIQLKPMPVVPCNCIKVKQDESLSLLHCLIHKGADLTSLSVCYFNMLYNHIVQKILIVCQLRPPCSNFIVFPLKFHYNFIVFPWIFFSLSWTTRIALLFSNHLYSIRLKLHRVAGNTGTHSFWEKETVSREHSGATWTQSILLCLLSLGPSRCHWHIFNGSFSRRLSLVVWPPHRTGMWDTWGFICSQPLKPDPVASMRALRIPE